MRKRDEGMESAEVAEGASLARVEEGCQEEVQK